LGHPFYTDEHESFRATVRRFVATEIAPSAAEWEEAGEFPRDLYAKASAAGLFGLGFPEEYGGVAADRFYFLILAQELARAGAGGVVSGLMIHTIGAPPIAALGSPELKARLLPPILAGEKICALAITEPGGGSDVAAVTTKAVRDGDAYRINGEKTFITSGMRADYYTVAVRTGGPGIAGLSLLVVEKGMRGFTQSPLKKMGWWASDTATLRFEDVRVPVGNMLGAENEGFRAIVDNFNGERLWMAAQCAAYSQVCLDESVAWARQRKVFGGALIDKQVIRHKLVDMAMRINATQALVEHLAWCMDHGDKPIGEIAMAKNQATQTFAYCASEAVQIHGGMGFMRGVTVERLYRDVKVNAIGGGSEEVMKELASRQAGWG
jgi:acyl-CoA dehydrogenase